MADKFWLTPTTGKFAISATTGKLLVCGTCPCGSVPRFVGCIASTTLYSFDAAVSGLTDGNVYLYKGICGTYELTGGSTTGQISATSGEFTSVANCADAACPDCSCTGDIEIHTYTGGLVGNAHADAFACSQVIPSLSGSNDWTVSVSGIPDRLIKFEVDLSWNQQTKDIKSLTESHFNTPCSLHVLHASDLEYDPGSGDESGGIDVTFSDTGSSYAQLVIDAAATRFTSGGTYKTAADDSSAICCSPANGTYQLVITDNAAGNPPFDFTTEVLSWSFTVWVCSIA